MDKEHEDTRVSLDGMTIEEALKKAMDAGSRRGADTPHAPSPDAPGHPGQRDVAFHPLVRGLASEDQRVHGIAGILVPRAFVQ